MKRKLVILAVALLLLSPGAMAQTWDPIAAVDFILGVESSSIADEIGNGVTWEDAFECALDLMQIDPAFDAAVQANWAQANADLHDTLSDPTDGPEEYLPGFASAMALWTTLGIGTVAGTEGFGGIQPWLDGWMAAWGASPAYSGDAAYDWSQHTAPCANACIGVDSGTCEFGVGEGEGEGEVGDLAVEIDGSILLALSRTKEYAAVVTLPATVAGFETETEFDVDIVYTWSGSDDETQADSHPITAATSAPLGDAIDFITDRASQAYVPIVGHDTIDVTANCCFVGDDHGAEQGTGTIYVSVQATLRETLANPADGPAQTLVLDGGASFTITVKQLDWNEDCEPLTKFISDLTLWSDPGIHGCSPGGEPFLNLMDMATNALATRLPDSFQLALLAYSLCNEGELDALPKDWTSQGFYHNPEDAGIALQYAYNLDVWRTAVTELDNLDNFLVTETIGVSIDPDATTPIEILINTITDFTAASTSPFPDHDTTYTWSVTNFDVYGFPTGANVYFINPGSPDSSTATGQALNEGRAIIRVTGDQSLYFDEVSIIIVGPDTPALDPNDPCANLAGEGQSSGGAMSKGYGADLLAVQAAWNALAPTEQLAIFNWGAAVGSGGGREPLLSATSLAELDKLMDLVLAKVAGDVKSIDGIAGLIALTSNGYGAFGDWSATWAAYIAVDYENIFNLDPWWLGFSNVALGMDMAAFTADIAPILMGSSDAWTNLQKILSPGFGWHNFPAPVGYQDLSSFRTLHSEALAEYLVTQMDLNMTLYASAIAPVLLSTTEQDLADALNAAKATQSVLGGGAAAAQSESHQIDIGLPRPSADPNVEPPSVYTININGAVATIPYNTDVAGIDALLEALPTLSGADDVLVVQLATNIFRIDFRNSGALADTDVNFHFDFSELLQNVPVPPALPPEPWDLTLQNGAGEDDSIVKDFAHPAWFWEAGYGYSLLGVTMSPYGAGAYNPANAGDYGNPLFTQWGNYNTAVSMNHQEIATAVMAAGGDYMDFVTAAVPLGGFWNGNPALPVGGMVGLGLLAGLFASSGAVLIRRRKK